MQRNTEPGRQVSFRVPADMYEKIGAAADFEDLAIADFCRKILRYGFRDYETAGSLHVLRNKSSDPEETVIPRKTKSA